MGAVDAVQGGFECFLEEVEGVGGGVGGGGVGQDDGDVGETRLCWRMVQRVKVRSWRV